MLRKISSLLLFVHTSFCFAVSPQLPVNAFWTDNHWRDVRGCAQEEPIHWRNTTGCLRILDEEGLRVNEQGLRELHISGSANPTLRNFQWMKNELGKKHKIAVVDLRQETHLLIDGLPVSIFLEKDQINWGKDDSSIRFEEKIWEKELFEQKKIVVSKLGSPVNGVKVPEEPLEIKIKKVQSEEEAVRSLGFEYFRLHVPDYHPPTPRQVDQFLNFEKNLPKNSWIHFHCAAGDGRTTTFMLITDIIHNADKVALEDLSKRQARLGGIDLLQEPASTKKEKWKLDISKARIDFLLAFYDYVKTKAHLKESFSDWIKENKKAKLYRKILTSEAYPS